jgi:hypothetical protein
VTFYDEQSKKDLTFNLFQVAKLQTLYFSNWFGISNIATREKILYMLMMQKRKKGLSAGGF